jgi:hypothetical protein
MNLNACAKKADPTIAAAAETGSPARDERYPSATLGYPIISPMGKYSAA